MSGQKTHAIVLSVMPYRESSCIVALLSRAHGRVNGIAKGIRRSPQAPLTIERGLLVELFLYVKPHRDLHTIGEVSVAGYFPSIRSDIGKLALRDAAFELILKSAGASEIHPELFDFAHAYLDGLDALSARPLPVYALWKFFNGWARLLGFQSTLDECPRCKSGATAAHGGVFIIESGRLLCSSCAPSAPSAPLFLPAEAVRILLDRESAAAAASYCGSLDASAQLRITGLLADYCRYHLEIKGSFKSLEFLESISRES